MDIREKVNGSFLIKTNMNKKYQDIIGNIDPSVKMLLDKVKRFLSAGKASVMVGCGFSINAENDGTGQMREWEGLNLDLYKSLYGENPNGRELISLDPIRLASQVESVHGTHELDELIKNALPDKSVYPGQIHKKLMKLHWRDVFTTNYDTLLERSCDESGSAYTLVTNKETLLYSKSPRIIKLHGSFPDVRPFIMSEEQFRTYPQKYPEFVNTVRQSLIENLFCLIGFSGNDPNFLSWLGWIRDVMGKQMTNAILVDYKPKGIHVSERLLFEGRKIDILNLADIKELKEAGSYKDAIDFFLTYLGIKERTDTWKYPDVHYHRMQSGKELPNYEEDINKMAKARTNYPGWIFLPEMHVETCGINGFPFMQKYYMEMPEEKKLRFLFELDWLLDVSMYPKDVDWYLEALNYVKDNVGDYKGRDMEMACQLVVSLLCFCRERRMLDEYMSISEIVSKELFDKLNSKQQSVFFYNQCLWYLSILDYKSVYAVLLKWHVMENDFLSALWQASVYAELGDRQVAEDILLIYYSRLTTRMLTESKSEYLSSCAQMYSYVMPRMIMYNRPDVDFPNDTTIGELKRTFVEDALKQKPKRSQSHGFNIGQMTLSSHMYQGGFTNDYLNANRYLKLTYLHGSTFRPGNTYNITEYGEILAIIAKYRFYQAIALAIRCGEKSLVEKIVSRENLSRISSEEISILFTDLCELVNEFEAEHHKKKDGILFGIMIPILQRLCCKAEDRHIQELFDFVMMHVDNNRIQRNDILNTIYNCATPAQQQMMFETVMNHEIVRDNQWNDILYPNYKGKINLSEESISYLLQSLGHKELRVLAYDRCVALLECELSDKQQVSLKQSIVEWRKQEKKDVNAFFSYYVVDAFDNEDKEIKQRWIKHTAEKFLNEDYSFKGSSESVLNFTHFLDNLLPALNQLNEIELNKVALKIVETLEGFIPQLKKDDRDDFLGGFRHFSTMMFDELTRIFERMDFGKVNEKIKIDLKSILQECFEEHHPCLFLLFLLSEREEQNAIVTRAYDRIFASEKDERTDAMMTLFHFFRRRVSERESEMASWDYVEKLSYYIQYSHSNNVGEYLYFLASLYAQRLLDIDMTECFAEALLAIHSQIGDYEMGYEYKIDIEYYACLFAAVLHQLGIEHKGIFAWQGTASDSEQFRDVKSGWIKGETMVK